MSSSRVASSHSSSSSRDRRPWTSTASSREPSRVSRARIPRDDERRTTTTTIERTIERARPTDVIFVRASTARTKRSKRPSRAHPRLIHPSTRARERSVGRPWRGSNRDRAYLLFLGRLRGARDDDGTGASSGVRGRVDRARRARVRDRSSRREHRRLLPPSRARGRATGDA